MFDVYEGQTLRFKGTPRRVDPIFSEGSLWVVKEIAGYSIILVPIDDLEVRWYWDKVEGSLLFEEFEPVDAQPARKFKGWIRKLENTHG